MKITKSIRISRNQLLAHKLRTALALLGIIIGVAAVIIMVAIGNGAQKEVLSLIESMGTDLIIVNAGQVQKSAGRQQISGTVTTLTLKDAEMIAAEIPDVKFAVPVQTKMMLVKSGNLSTNTTITGTTPDFQEVRNFHVEKGSFFTEEDNRASIRNAVPGRTVVENLFGSSDPVGETIRIGRVTFNVTGVMESKGVDMNGVDQDDQIFIPLQTALRRVFNLTYINTINIQPNSPDNMQNVVNQVSEILRERHRLDRLKKPDDFTIQTQVELLDTQKETTDTFTSLIVGIASISLLVGGIGILAIMLIAIRERINEIGLRMAVGASKKDILVQFVIEASILSISGGVIGIIFGVVVSIIVSMATQWNLSISVPSIIYSFLFSMIIGIFFGVYPARKASLLDPIEALKNE
ncbi:MAG: ABC transporter permease [Bacteroidales bacterium]|nr:ABC transporter permease [Bacteroidales bacterium]